MSVADYRLFACPGWGSALAEAALTLCGLPFTVEAVEMTGGPVALDALRRANPLAQVPTLVLPDGRVMTESAAIMLQLADIAPAAGLVPREPGARRDVFLRWLMFIVASIYPTHFYGDEPSRWVNGTPAQDDLRHSTDAMRERLWSQVEAAIAPDPWIVGGFTALDIYVTVMVHWRPRLPWFETHCPKLHRVAQAGLALPTLAGVWERNGFLAAASR